VEAKLDQERYLESPKAKREGVGAAEVPPRKKQKKAQERVLRESKGDDILKEQAALAKCEINKDSYSKERMREALVSVDRIDFILH
jgi:hypothetical protein